MIGIVGVFTVAFYLSNARQKHGAVLQNTVRGYFVFWTMS